MSFLSARMKELKKASTFPKPLPIWRGCKLKVAETDDLSWVLVSRDTRWYGDYAWLVAYGGWSLILKLKGGFYEVF